MKTVHLGSLGLVSAKIKVADWLVQATGMSGERAMLEVTAGFERLQEQQVYTVDGVPFFEHGGNLIPFATNIYQLYISHYLPLIQRLGGQPVPGIFYPVMVEADSFDSYLRKIPFDYRSHMVGNKSNRVHWSIMESKADIRDIIYELSDSYREHVVDINQRFGTDSDVDASVSAWLAFPELSDDKLLTWAMDMHTGKTIAAMQVFRDGHHYDCVALAFPKTPEYRPYSITACCHLAVTQHVYEMGYTDASINYGINQPGIGDYKRNFAATETIYGITASDAGL